MNRLDSIKYFCLAVETLNFRETADRLAVSPSVVTRAIAELESELGEQLFKRNTRKMTLTSFGEQFLPRAKHWLAEADLLFGTKNQPLDEMNGVVRIAVPKLQYQSQILQALLTALEPSPNLIIDWQADTAKLNSIENRIDMGVRIGQTANPDFIVRHIADSRHIFVASPSYLQRHDTPKDVDDMVRHFPMSVLLNPSTGRAWDISLADGKTLVPRHLHFISTDPYAELEATLAGRTIAQLSDLVCRPYLARNELVTLFPEMPCETWKVYLYRPYQTVTPARVLKVFDLLEGILRKYL
ncbi:LysR family transcriptional regulator [Pasteurella multocida]|uniref:LysR family transcriptional regulator n=1 Tax=Pasteurella multocida TaxID=747 RepID=UPI002024E27B|nr:LysR family transcriptional regulator [Pasteurella multocida]URK01771.1 LysR family transcriptional regulator [Pasteurella multocida]HDR1859255.1 LysR family transcriptional regulator [Pasteurella multocida]HDR1894324.1 LysR family transcriptional regulator [Pasteurella multocida]